MSLMGVDVGTTGCKACVFSEAGRLLASAYCEYDFKRPQPGWAELDSHAVWDSISEVIQAAAGKKPEDPVKAICPSSMGEAVVPVTRERHILGPSLLNFDERGAEYLPELGTTLSDERLFEINGNTLGNHYTLPKLMWLRDHTPSVFSQADYFMHWGALVGFMLGAEPYVDYCLANRTLLFDLQAKEWSAELAAWGGIDLGKLPTPVPTGTVVGKVTPSLCREWGLAPDTVIVAGAHDQCANAVGCGVLEPGTAMIGMGTYIAIVPVFTTRPNASDFMPIGLSTEHHAAKGRYVCFVYNHGGSLVKWYRDTFAAMERDLAKQNGEDIYPTLFREVPEKPTGILVLPHFAPTGPPQYLADSSGVILGLRLGTTRGEILRGILESTLYYLRECLDPLVAAGVPIETFRAVGGGSHSDIWLQMVADIFQRPVTRAAVPEAGALGGAILAGTALGTFSSLEEGAARMVKTEQTFYPSKEQTNLYQQHYQTYRSIYPSFQNVLRPLP